ncbi:MAG: prolyl oligopeptidase family serine peptidase [Patescibacteria group bacterium]
MQILHTFFKGEIFSDFIIPAKPSHKVAIICSGAPAVPSKKTLMEFLAKKGYWTFHIRYRGTWESRGTFLKKSPHQDLLDVIDDLSKGFTELWTKKQYKINPKKILLTGSSFGGAAVIMAAQDPRVTAGIAFSPVVDWSATRPDEPHGKFVKFMQEAYGSVYHSTPALWKKLLDEEFYTPSINVDGSKLMIVHAKDDRIVRLKEVREFAKKTKSHFVLLNKGGHLSSSNIMRPQIWKKVKKMVG